MEKYLIDPARLRHLPPRFSWLDQRLVTAQHLRECSRSAQALYLFLAVVSDAEGLSYYSDKSIGIHLAISREELLAARRCLIERSLLLFERPLYQLVCLEPHKTQSLPRFGCTMSVSELIRLPQTP